MCVFNPQSLAGLAPHAKVRLCRSAAQGQAFRVEPDLTRHFRPAEAPICIRHKAGLPIVAFRAPGCLTLAAYDPASFLCLTLGRAGGIASTSSSFVHTNHRDHCSTSSGPFQPSSGTRVGYVLLPFLDRIPGLPGICGALQRRLRVQALALPC